MEKTPKFIRAFSKEESPEERQQAADAIRAKRAEHFDQQRAQAERQAELQRSIGEREGVLAEQLESLQRLENELNELSTSRLEKILNFFQLRKLRADLAVGQRTVEELKQQHDVEALEHRTISKTSTLEESPPELKEAKTMLSDFYRQEKKKWVNSEYTTEEIAENFSEEHLASLSFDEYILLLQRFPREMVAHVTRQGIRDHTGHMFHTTGEGAYTNGFMRMVGDGRLRSPLGVYIMEAEKEKAVARYLRLDRFQTQDEAFQYLDTLTNDDRQSDSGSYVDRMAVHFATEEVADCFYGSEKGNEIFVAYPSAYIASQYYFSGRLREGGGGYWNDQWVWANEERGMDLNAGIVFIPESAKVDRNTGSRYELDNSGNPMIDAEVHAALRRVIDAPNFHDFAQSAMEVAGRLIDGWGSSQLKPFRQRLEQEFGITDPRLQKAMLTYDHLIRLDLKKQAQAEGRKDTTGSIDEEINQAMKAEGILYTEAMDPISSKEFWEKYFAEHASKRPSKIVYYKGSDPTRALDAWRATQGLNKKADDENIGFPQRHLERDAPQARAGLDRFKILAEEVIRGHFAARESGS